MPYQKIKLISFDLDNTLYDNKPVIQLAERKSQAYLCKAFDSQGKIFSYGAFVAIRDKLITRQNSLPAEHQGNYENLSLLRLQVLKELCRELHGAQEIVQQAFNIFIKYRNKINIDPSIFHGLSQLAKDYRLVSVTNGNCDAGQLSIGALFSNHYSPQANYRAKPHPQMLLSAMQDFQVQAENLLHVGDNIATDGIAAETANCPFYLLSPFEQDQIDHNQFEQLTAMLIK